MMKLVDETLQAENENRFDAAQMQVFKAPESSLPSWPDVPARQNICCGWPLRLLNQARIEFALENI